MPLLFLVDILLVLNIIHCLKQRKFYKEYSTTLTGTVVSLKRMYSNGDRMNPMYYALTVQTDEGEFYVESNNRKVRKYCEGKEVTILIVPRTPLPELPPETLAKLTPEELETLEKVRAAASKTEALENKLTILKEDQKRMSEIVFCIISGIFFGVLSIAAVLDRFM